MVLLDSRTGPTNPLVASLLGRRLTIHGLLRDNAVSRVDKPQRLLGALTKRISRDT